MDFRARMIFVARRRLDAADAVDALRLRRPSAPRPSVTSIRDTGVGARQGVYHQTDATRGTRWTHFGCVDHQRRAIPLHPSEIPVWVHARVSITRPTQRGGRAGRTSAASTVGAAPFGYIHPRYRCGCTPGCLSPDRRDAGDALDALRLRRPPTPRDSVTSIRDTGVGARQGVYHQGTRWTHFGCVDRRRRAIPLHPSEIPVWVHARVSITRCVCFSFVYIRRGLR
ncbi:hypothetical protein BKA62DRAFT_763638 [Auriculariales sp. MPI-PUGE-AT-0066]|nr:hypothetical protein BKA62DRAFT_763638 [Auriculariales sp. MPI-PUGE-AT-0066]